MTAAQGTPSNGPSAVSGRPDDVGRADQPGLGQPGVDQAGLGRGGVDLPVRGVTLFSSGVGYFDHVGTVHGDTSVDLMFKTEQVNDILKSLVLQDLDGGTVSGVNYASQEPLDRKLASFRVNLGGNPSLAALLSQLRGAEVIVGTPGGDIAGVIVSVEERPVGTREGEDGRIATRPVLTILSKGALRSFPLDAVTGLTLTDEKLRDELTRALSAVASAADQDKKPVTIHFAGTGERRVRVGYVVQTPVWKTSYRLLLGGAGGGGGDAKGNLQGWAIVENQTDRDWKDVQLSLVSGRPLSFVQDLYTPLYTQRPVVTPELFAGLKPPVYDAGLSQVPAVAAAPALSGALRRMNAAAGGTESFAKAREGALADANEPIDAAASVRATVSGARVGELFQYTVGSVSLPRQSSSMIPIVTDAVEVEKVSIYNASVLPRNPLSGARLKNTTGKHLLQGPITVLDGGNYAGDARIDDLPPGQQRWLSYGIDAEVLVDAVNNRTTSEVQTARIDRGVLTLVRKVVRSQDYRLENKGPADKVVILEHPRAGSDPDLKFVDTPDPVETTDAVYRFRTSVAAGKTERFTVRQQAVRSEGVRLVNASTSSLLAYVQGGGLPDNVRSALEKAVELQRRIATSEKRIEDIQAEVETISADQGRVRENLRTVDNGSDFGKRLLARLADMEGRIEKLAAERDQLQTDLAEQRKALSDYLASLSV